MRRTLSKVFVPVSAVLVGTLPMIALAQAQGTTGALSNNVQSFLTNVNGWVNSLLVILFVTAIAAFFWGLIKYLYGSKDADHKKGLQQMGMGILALFVMASIWGLVGFMQGTLGIGAGHAPSVQSLQIN